MLPIGPKARHLNRDFAYADGSENQLAHWTRNQALVGAPDPNEAPRLAVWNDPPTGTLDERARAWLEINCAHCHNPVGPARNSGLDLMASQTSPNAIRHLQDAGGRGPRLGRARLRHRARQSGGVDHDVSHRLDRSRGIMMPELGKRLIHEEGVELVREWIAAMPPGNPMPRAIIAERGSTLGHLRRSSATGPTTARRGPTG